jgi:rhodanese-related sulfurtransferase
MSKTITAEALKDKIDAKDDFILIEVLLPEKYAEWHLPGAINIPTDELEREALKSIDKDTEIIVYCLSFTCKASSKAAKILRDLGYSDVIDYEGGKSDWLEKGFPVER